MKAALLALLLVPKLLPAAELGLIEAHCAAPFPEAMAWLQQVVQRQGYTVMQVQPVSEALSHRGYAGQDFKVVFIGRGDDFKQVQKDYPQLMPFLPLSLTLADVENGARLSLMPPTASGLSPPPTVRRLMQRWRSDLTRIAMRFNDCP